MGPLTRRLMVAAVASLLAAPAMTSDQAVDQTAMAKIRDEALRHSGVAATFHTITTRFGPRLTGSPAHKAAADWARGRLREWGLEGQVVLIGAHLDSWHSATGSTDNADGAVEVTEAMRILKASGLRPRRTIRAALWSGEEQGLLGSKAYVQQHLAGDAHRDEREKFDVYFNNDPGTGPIYGWYLENNAEARSIFDAWLAPFRDLGARRNVLHGIGNTDHLSFIAAGLPGFNPVQDYGNYDTHTHHTNVDTDERVRDQDLQQAAVIMAAFAYDAAMADQKIPRVQK